MKKILIVTPGFPKDEQDISCLPYLQDYVLQLSQKIGSENIVVVSTQYPFTRKKYWWNNIAVYPSGGRNKKHFYYYFTMRRTLRRLLDLLAHEAFILHAFWMGEAAFVAQRAAKQTGTPLIINLMGQDARAGNRVMRYIDADYAHIIAISENQNKAFFEAYHIHADHVLSLPVPEFNATINADRNIDLLFVGSMISIKQPEQFVDVVASLVKNFPQLKAVMIGDGHLSSSIHEKIQSKNLHNHISMVGNISRSAVFEYMQRSKVLLHTSSYEGQCHSFAEALAYGMYIVSYDVGRIENSPKHIIAQTSEEMTSTIQTLLSSTHNFTPITILSDMDVVAEYAQLYMDLSE